MRSDAHDTPARSSDQAASNDRARSFVRLKFPALVDGVDMQVRAQTGARGRDCDSGSAVRRRRAPGKLKSSLTGELFGSVRKLAELSRKDRDA